MSGSAEIETSNGSIELKTTSLPDSPTLKAKTKNGNIFMEVPSTVNAHLSLHTSNGRIHERLRDVEVTHNERSKRRIEATLNGGGGHSRPAPRTARSPSGQAPSSASVAEKIPTLAEKAKGPTTPKSCIHCHMVTAHVRKDALLPQLPLDLLACPVLVRLTSQ